jgi:hypothetical protein
MTSSGATDSVVVCTFALGAPLYFHALRETIRSVLRHTPFDIFSVVGSECPVRLPESPRIRYRRVDPSPPTHRSQGFLAKLGALQACLEESNAELVLWLDADAVFTRTVSAAEVCATLADREIGMVEQVPAPGSPHSRAFFYDHYRTHTRRWFDALGDPPPLDVFRFFNRGVVLAKRQGLAELCAWALATIDRLGTRHEVGAHMISDQDYLQYWANEVRPGSAIELDWSWNHCEHWHGDFPRHGVRIAHLSNACQGLTRRNLWRLRALRLSPSIERVWRRWRRTPPFEAAFRLLRATRGS